MFSIRSLCLIGIQKMAKRDDKALILNDLARIKNVGPSRAELLYEDLKVRSIEQLVEIAQQGELINLSGIGASTQQKILAAALEQLALEQAAEAQPVKEVEEAEEGELNEPEVIVAVKVGEEDIPLMSDPAQDEEPEEAVSEGALSRFLATLICPNCGNESFETHGPSLTCTACRREYGFQNRVADLAPPYRRGSNLTQRVMESRFYSRFYEDVMRPKLTSVITERTLREEYALSTELLDLEASSRLLDVACGTGNFTRYFAQRLDALDVNEGSGQSTSLLVGVDLSWPMLEIARKYMRRDQLEEHIFLVRGDATRLPVRRGAFDRLHCAAALHFMDDIDEALRNFACVLERGGLCVISTFIMGDGFVRKLAKRIAEVPTKFHWFTQKELYARMERAGFELIEESIEGDAITVKARKR